MLSLKDQLVSGKFVASLYIWFWQIFFLFFEYGRGLLFVFVIVITEHAV